MAKKVFTGCRDCVKCMGSSVNVGARNVTRGMLAVGTGGVTEFGMAFMPKCRVCGHQKSLHRESLTDKLSRKFEEQAAEREAREKAEMTRQRAAQAKAARNRQPSAADLGQAPWQQTAEFKQDKSELDAMMERIAKRQRSSGESEESEAATIEPSASSGPPPGFYTNPKGDADLLRWWDGTGWTEFTKPKD